VKCVFFPRLNNPNVACGHIGNIQPREKVLTVPEISRPLCLSVVVVSQDVVQIFLLFPEMSRVTV